MLLDGFYKIIEIKKETATQPGAEGISARYTCRVRINGEHEIFAGHFPGNPVVPGVCQLEMIRGSASRITGKNLRMAYSDNIKYLSMIQPGTNAELEITIDIRKPGDLYEIHAVISAGDSTFLKFKGNFIEE